LEFAAVEDTTLSTRPLVLLPLRGLGVGVLVVLVDDACADNGSALHLEQMFFHSVSICTMDSTNVEAAPLARFVTAVATWDSVNTMRKPLSLAMNCNRDAG
jgi:hypothetical protein